MIELGGNFVLEADSGNWMVKKRSFTTGEKSKVAGKEVLSVVGYYSDPASALMRVAQIMIREKVASGEVDTLVKMIAEYRVICDDLRALLTTTLKEHVG